MPYSRKEPWRSLRVCRKAPAPQPKSITELLGLNRSLPSDLMMVDMRVFHWSRSIPLNPFAWWRGSSSPMETPLVSQMASHSVLVEAALLEPFSGR